MNLTSVLSENINIIKSEFENCDDVVFRNFNSGDIYERACVLIFTEGMCDKEFLSEMLLEKIMSSDFSYPQNEKKILSGQSPKISIPVYDYKTGNTFSEAYSLILSGNGVLLIDGKDYFISISSTKLNSRSINEAESKSVIRGPRDGFTESFLDSTSLLRRRIKSSSLKMEHITSGKDASSRIALCYMKNKADTELVANIRDKINNLNISVIIDSGQVQNELSETKGLFSDIQSTERADDAAFALSEGKIVLVVENSPFVLIIPGLLFSMLTSTEDYYSSDIKRTAIMSMRIISCVTTILLPAIYIGFVKFNPDFLPDKLILLITQSRKNVALPPFMEILFVQLVLEIIMEASIRLPKQISSAVGIVGSIVIGQAIVDANLVNIMAVITVSVNAVLTFVIPSFELSKSLRILRLVFMAAASLSGIYGVLIGFVTFIMYLADKDSFGTEYLFPAVCSENINAEKLNAE